MITSELKFGPYVVGYDTEEQCQRIVSENTHWTETCIWRGYPSYVFNIWDAQKRDKK